jgi:hypothetical protein
MLLQIIKVIVPIVIALILSYDPVKIKFSTTTFERIVISCITYILWTCIDILRYSKKAYERELHHAEIWSIDSDFELLLNNIRKHYHDISKQFYGSRDLYKDYFIEKLSSLLEIIKNSAEKHELYVENYHFSSTELVLDAFKGAEVKILRYVWILEYNEPFFNDIWKNYCMQIDDTIKQHQIKEVRALFLRVPDLNVFDERVAALLGFYTYSKGYDYRIIDNNIYNRLLHDSQIDEEYIDFGIYGNRYLFRTKKYEPIPCGDFSKDKSLIDRYIKFFDLVWKSPSSIKYDKTRVIKTELSQLFDIDARFRQTN